MSSKSSRFKRWCLYCILVIHGVALFLILLGIINGLEMHNFFSRGPKSDYERHSSLVAELKTLSQFVNKTVEEVAQEVLDQQTAIKEKFYNSGSKRHSIHRLSNFLGINVASSQMEMFTEACRDASNQRLLMVFPIRDRWNLLRSLLKELLPLLQKPNLCVFKIVVEQTDSMAFNKALLMNVAVIEMAKQVPFDCIIFHDVDLIPTSGDEVYYECPSYPRHLSVKVDKLKYDLPYLGLIGGVFALPLRHFLQANGYSNMFWGWGAEDDDMFERLAIVGIPVTRPMPNPTRYIMLPHRKSSTSDYQRATLLLGMAFERYRLDGLNSVRYRVLKNERRSVCEVLGVNPKLCQLERSHITYILVDPQKIETH
ncbi:unnamed protein product [Rodentolepis nana]|uniref:Beta-1,4-galactosyltransferase n=1 Tax=Rodentolepis nana TaxID=102285 RepID=A0A0R3TQZ9_RODNA|nr:unnamed protein product [Rodentolepis nana]